MHSDARVVAHSSSVHAPRLCYSVVHEVVFEEDGKGREGGGEGESGNEEGGLGVRGVRRWRGEDGG